LALITLGWERLMLAGQAMIGPSEAEADAHRLLSMRELPQSTDERLEGEVGPPARAMIRCVERPFAC